MADCSDKLMQFHVRLPRATTPRPPVLTTVCASMHFRWNARGMCVQPWGRERAVTGRVGCALSIDIVIALALIVSIVLRV